jgi:transcriptional regulator with XRE-family HTH domain
MKKTTFRLVEKLLGTDFDSELAKIAGVSRTRIWQLRNKKGIPAFKPPKGSPHPRTIANEKKLKIFLKKYKNKDISLRLIREKIGISQYRGKPLNLNVVLDFAEKNKIKIQLKRRPNSEFSHGRRAYSKKLCNCVICKLSNNINTQFRNLKTPLRSKHIDELANKYIKRYLNDKSFKRQKFWKFLKKTAKKYLGK